MRRKEKQITERSEIDAVIRGCRICHLALAVDNIPYVVPLCYGYDGTSLYFHTAASGKKIDFLKTNPRVCFQMERDVRLADSGQTPCDWTFYFESVIGSGLAQELLDPDERESALGWIVRQYGAGSGGKMSLSPGLKIWRIAIQELSGKRSRPGKSTA